MPKTYNIMLERVLKALGNSTRRNIIIKLYLLREATFSDLMLELNLDPKKDSGKFAHHLKILINAGVIKEDVEKRVYKLTDVGEDIALLIQEFENKIIKKERMLLVRTSGLTMEPFERRRIVEALMRETSMPLKLAEQIAKEAEERILKSDIKYLTAPLIREVVNSILLEHGLEDYRHSMTRLGLPVYDVERMIYKRRRILTSPLNIYFKAGNAVISEYILIKKLPREISDAHISGLINLNNLSYWSMLPESIHHNASCFLNCELNLDDLETTSLKIKSAENLDDALENIIKIIYFVRMQISVGQVLDDINVMLAPLVKNMSYEEIVDKVRKLIFYLNQLPEFRWNFQPLAIGLKLDKSLEKDGFFEEKLLLFKAFTKNLHIGDYYKKAFFTPLPIIKVDSHIFKHSVYNEEVNEICKLIREWSTPIIVNLDWEDNKNASYCWDLSRITYDNSCQRSFGILSTVLLNLPRIALDSRGNDEKFFTKLLESLELSIKALNNCRERINGKTLMLTYIKVNGNDYNCVEDLYSNIGIIGLYESVKIHTGKLIHESSESLIFAKKVVDKILEVLKDHQQINITECSIENAGRRLLLSDFLRYGLKTINDKIGTGINEYTCNTLIPHNIKIPLNKRIEVESVFHKKMLGGHYFKIHFRELIPSNETIFDNLKQLINDKKLALFTFSKDFTYCKNCGKLLSGTLERCSYCKISSGIVHYSKYFNTYTKTNQTKEFEVYLS
ncbi:MAG: hypothetical protein NZ926_01625 [Candidatus Methanomethylicia archaeon]|nr:hypothetical protein [Candidatus Methanomethylicia archaeon]MCX8169122.1 hypothetical protein [Candidatus Methanomethylicia archaeon]MDW7988854.1 anaerobic ribonucleoside-triphosphate reductase [Nitrososphaerota archaeon]